MKHGSLLQPLFESLLRVLLCPALALYPVLFIAAVKKSSLFDFSIVFSVAYKSKVLLHKTPRPELLSEVTFGQDRLLSSQIRLPGSGTQVEERTSQGKR